MTEARNGSPSGEPHRRPHRRLPGAQSFVGQAENVCYVRRGPKGRPESSIKLEAAIPLIDGGVAAVTLVQTAWRGVVARRVAAAVKVAVMASKKEAVAFAAEQQSMLKHEAQLDESLAAVMSGQQLGFAAMVRGDMKKLRALYGAAVATIARAMKAYALKCVAIKAVEERRATVAALVAAASKAADERVAQQAVMHRQRRSRC
jgi:hypothetical protein